MAYYVYLLASKKHGTLCLGVTNDIVRRVYEYRIKAVPGFTKRYDVDKLVWFEIYDDAITAIAREKVLKKWRRDWKVRLIEEENPGWVDLYPVSQADIAVMDSGPAPRGAPRNDEMINLRNSLATNPANKKPRHRCRGFALL
jgi:putative endonuclease